MLGGTCLCLLVLRCISLELQSVSASKKDQKRSDSPRSPPPSSSSSSSSPLSQPTPPHCLKRCLFCLEIFRSQNTDLTTGALEDQTTSACFRPHFSSLSQPDVCLSTTGLIDATAMATWSRASPACLPASFTQRTLL